MKNEINLLDLSNYLGNIHVKINQAFLKSLMMKASENKKPHLDREFMKKLKMKPQTRYGGSMTIYGWTQYDKTIPLNKLSKIVELAKHHWQKVESKITYLKAGQHGGEISPKFPIKLNRELGSITGHILGDGSIDLKYNQVFYSNSNKELLKEFESCMYKIFGIKPRIWMQRTSTFEGKTRWEKRLNNIDELKDGRNCGLFYPTICGLVLNHALDNFAVGINKKITRTILKTNVEFKRGLIKAFYDDEGTVDKHSGYIRLFQDRKEILEKFSRLLKEFGISTSPIKAYIRRDKERYYFNIHRKSNFIKFQKEIGFTSKKKSERLKQLTIIKNYKNSR